MNIFCPSKHPHIQFNFLNLHGAKKQYSLAHIFIRIE
jgi:hypothetical protein